MNKSLFEEKGALRTISRARVSWIQAFAIWLVILGTAWYIGWSDYVEPLWILRWFGVLIVVAAAWMIVFAGVQKNICQIHGRKKIVISTSTTWNFKRVTHQYAWDHFSAVRTILIYAGDHQLNQVELVTKDTRSALTVAYFPAVTKPGERSIFAAPKYENPLAVQMRAELSALMSLTNQGYIKEYRLPQLQ